ncbi:MAG: hypothetical protein WBR21_08260 [Rouxiella badensis]|uniref:phage tail assembly chaperone n=1 Tax=Rouxiella badensis TaxID=1646377 RepID=UPI003C4010ED
MEFEIETNTYRTGKLSVFDQLKISRKLLPILAGLASEFGSLKDLKGLAAENEGSDPTLDKFAPLFEKVLPKIADTLSGLTEEDTNAIIHPCLAVVSRKAGNKWTPVFSQGELMFDDINLVNMLQLVGRVVVDSLGNFLPDIPAKATPPLTAD